jgi:hypothetical protein
MGIDKSLRIGRQRCVRRAPRRPPLAATGISGAGVFILKGLSKAIR